jgi:hypothetical protein
VGILLTFALAGEAGVRWAPRKEEGLPPAHAPRMLSYGASKPLGRRKGCADLAEAEKAPEEARSGATKPFVGQG